MGAAIQLIGHHGEVLSTWPYPGEHRARIAQRVAQAGLDRRALTVSIMAEHHGMPPVAVRADLISRVRLVLPEPAAVRGFLPYPAEIPADDHYDHRARAAGEKDSL